MIVESASGTSVAGGERTQVSAAERRERLGQTRRRGHAFTAPSFDDARALAFVLERQLFDLGRVATVLESSNDAAQLACARGGLIAIATGRGAPELRVEGEQVHVDDTSDPERVAAALVETLRRRGTF